MQPNLGKNVLFSQHNYLLFKIPNAIITIYGVETFDNNHFKIECKKTFSAIKLQIS